MHLTEGSFASRGYRSWTPRPFLADHRDTVPRVPEGMGRQGMPCRTGERHALRFEPFMYTLEHTFYRQRAEATSRVLPKKGRAATLAPGSCEAVAAQDLKFGIWVMNCTGPLPVRR